MTKLEAIIRPNRFDQVKEALGALGVEGMTVSEVRGHGRQKARRKLPRPRVLIEAFYPSSRWRSFSTTIASKRVIEAIIKNAVTGEIGDGKIFLYKAEDAIRIRNRERGPVAL